MMVADSQFLWIDGKLVPYDAAQAPILSHTLHYGTGVFEGIRAYQTVDKKTAVFRAKEHFERLHYSAGCLGITIKFDIETLIKGMCETIRANKFAECYIRPIAYIDDSFRGLKLPAKTSANVAIAVWSWGKYLGGDSLTKGIRIMISSYRRGDEKTSLPSAKVTGGYITSVLARGQASAKGLDEALMLDPSDHVAEGSGENIFVVKGSHISTPSIGSILPGITRDSVMKIAKVHGYNVKEEKISCEQLMAADELFFTGTAAEVTPICEVDGKKIGSGVPGPITTKLAQEYFKCVRGELENFKSWLTYV